MLTPWEIGCDVVMLAGVAWLWWASFRKAR